MLRKIARLRPVLAALAAFAVLTGAREVPDRTVDLESTDFLTGKLLVAAPDMPDPRFKETVILVVEHDHRGALGLVVNRRLGTVELARFFENLGLESKNVRGVVRIHYGGPVQPEFGFVIHSTDFSSGDTREVTPEIAVSPEAEVLRAIAHGEGPRRVLFAVGYAGWGPGQLEEEMRRDDWFTAPADLDIVFDDDVATKWKRAMARRYRSL